MPCHTTLSRFTLEEWGPDFNRQFFPTDIDGEQHVSLIFGRSVITHETQSYRVGLNDMISAAGGGLGLFMGFSLLSTLTYAFTFIDKK